MTFEECIRRSVASRFRQYRQRLRLRQSDVAVGVFGSRAHAVVSNVERGKREVTVSELWRAALLFGVSPLDFFPESGVGARLRQLRLARGMSQAEVGFAVFGPGFGAEVRQIEGGQRAPTPQELYRFAQVFGVSLAELMGPVA